ncbi:MAG: Uncharacterised protein [Cyanobium sp. ARS6]|nr:MAG: Uncharacterised protein [Cyanobium sp. ARS6]
MSGQAAEGCAALLPTAASIRIAVQGLKQQLGGDWARLFSGECAQSTQIGVVGPSPRGSTAGHGAAAPWIGKKGLLEAFQLLVKHCAISTCCGGCARCLRWSLDPLLPSELIASELGIDQPRDLLGFTQSIPVVLKAQAEPLHRSQIRLFATRQCSAQI